MSSNVQHRDSKLDRPTYRIKGGESVVVNTQSWSYRVYFDVFVPVRMVTSRSGRVRADDTFGGALRVSDRR